MPRDVSRPERLRTGWSNPALSRCFPFRPVATPPALPRTPSDACSLPPVSLPATRDHEDLNPNLIYTNFESCGDDSADFMIILQLEKTRFPVLPCRCIITGAREVMRAN